MTELLCSLGAFAYACAAGNAPFRYHISLPVFHTNGFHGAHTQEPVAIAAVRLVRIHNLGGLGFIAHMGSLSIMNYEF